MATPKKTSSPKEKTKTGRAKPLVHTPGLTKTKRRFGCGGSLKSKKTS